MSIIRKTLLVMIMGLLVSTSISISGDLPTPPVDYQPPTKMDEETAKDFARYTLYRIPIENLNELQWDELQVRLYPFYDIYGKNKLYLAIVYLGEGKMPSDEVLKKKIKAGYEMQLRGLEEYERQGKELPADMYNAIMSARGYDVDKDEWLYISVIFSEATSGDFVKSGSPTRGLPKLLLHEPSVIRAVEDYTGESAKVKGYFGSRLTGVGYKILSGDQYYYIRGKFEHWPEEQIMLKDARENVFDEKYEEFKQRGEVWQNSIDTFRRILYTIETNPDIIDGTYIGSVIDNDNETGVEKGEKGDV